MRYYLFTILYFCLFLFSSTYSLDFDVSLGKGDCYYGKYYDMLVLSLNTIDYIYPSWSFCFQGKPAADFFSFCRSLYNKNNLLRIKPDKHPRIPLKIHQIWLGSPFPEKYKNWQKTWKLLKKLGFKYKLWTDKDIEALPMVNRDIYNQAKNLGQKSDIARIEILNLYGGIYADTDCECLNPKMIAMLNRCYDFYCALSPLDEQVLYVCNAFIAAAKGHPLLKAYIDELPNNWYNSTSEIVSLKTGPAYLTKLLMSNLDKGTKDIVLPPTVLYPLGFEQSKSLFEQGLSQKKIKELVVKPESVAIHWWEGSWKAPIAKAKG